MEVIDEEELAQTGIANFATYEDFLESNVTPLDLAFLGDVNVCRMLVELGYRGSREGCSKSRFLAAKKLIDERKKAGSNFQTYLISIGKTYEEPLVRAMQQREESNRTGKIASIFCIRDFNKNGQEISGYVDYAHRLATEDFEPIFAMQRRFLPKETDLSFYNWDTGCVKGRSSPNYEVIAMSASGMLFRNRRDGKTLNPNPTAPTVGDNSSRTIVPTETYISVIIFDHYNRRRV